MSVWIDLLGSLSVIIQLITFFAILINNPDCGYSFLNPFYIYDEINVNWFGCAVITLVLNLVFNISAIVYWSLKLIVFLFTVGRK
jgi:hypothetical protein